MLNSLFENYLPINRKERFYTGTVFSQIVCADNFKHFDKFISLINGFPQNVKAKFQGDINIHLTTEYSLNESVGGVNKRNFVQVPKSKETPDIIILFTSPHTVLISIEAKMFNKTSFNRLQQQIWQQEKAIESITQTLSINDNNIFRIGLVPAKMIPKNKNDFFQLLHWEEIIDVYREVISENYFYKILEFAISNYDSLVSGKMSKRKRKTTHDVIDKNSPWHFSHLGRSYFDSLVAKLGYKDIYSAPISKIYLGNKGVEYSLLKKGKNVRPNWCVKMNNGDEYKCYNWSSAIPVKGLWNLYNCNEFEWKNIVSYFELNKK